VVGVVAIRGLHRLRRQVLGAISAHVLCDPTPNAPASAAPTAATTSTRRPRA
jgi:hypothetical protein